MKKCKGYLIYLDVLGYKNILSNKNDDDINSLESFIDSIDKKAIASKVGLFIGKGKIIFRTYSDNFLIFYKAKTFKPDVFAGVIYFASNIIGNAICKGFMMRGSIVFGELSANKQSVFGKDIISAYDLESNHNEPCIVLDKNLKQKYEEFGMHEDDLLSPFTTFHKNDKSSAKLYALGIKRMILRLNAQPIVDEKTLNKHRWLINEFNRYFAGNYHIDFKESPSHYEIEMGDDDHISFNAKR